jgi:hypothetical protein
MFLESRGRGGPSRGSTRGGGGGDHDDEDDELKEEQPDGSPCNYTSARFLEVRQTLPY